MAYGTINADVIGTSVANTSLGAGNASIMKNRIINGAMVIDQRNAGASTTSATNGGYTLDRWATQNNSGASRFTVQRNAGSITPPAGFSNYLGCTSTGSYTVGSGDAIGMIQRIEGYNIADLGWGAAGAKTVTLSVWVYSSLTGTFGGSLFNGNGNYSYPFTYTISSANTWQQISVTITGATSSSWSNDNSTGLNVLFALGTGSSLSGTAGSWSANGYYGATGQTQWVATNGATFYITGVQLEVGSSATGFEYRQYTTELQLCQRYFWKSTPASNQYFVVAQCQSSSSAFGGTIYFPVTMRASPTTAVSSISNFQPFNSAGALTTAFTSGGFANAMPDKMSSDMGGSSGLTSGNASCIFVVSSGWASASAEL